MLTNQDLSDLEGWYGLTLRKCNCNDCKKLRRFADNYFEFRDGAEFQPEMLEGLTAEQHEAFIRLICMRNLEERKP